MKAITAAVIGAAAMVAGCSSYGSGYGPRSAGYNGWGAYDYDRVDPAYGGYYADATIVTDRAIASAASGIATASTPARMAATIAAAATARPD